MRLLLLIALAGCARPEAAPDAPATAGATADSAALGPDDPMWAFRFMAPETVPETIRQAARAQTPLDSLGRGPDGEPLSPDAVEALAAAADTSATGSVDLISGVGVFWSGEVTAADGARWQGLYPGGDVRSFRLSVASVPHPILDTPGDSTTGIRIRTPFSTIYDDGGEFDEVTVLVRRPSGPFPSDAAVAQEKPWPIESGRLAVSLGERDYALEVVEGPEVGRGYDGEPYRVRRVLVLALDGVRQPVADIVDRDEGYPTVLWAGDLDGDGRLDLLLDESNHYNMSVMTLFLSSEARAGELVRRAARHVGTGC